jgi:cysteine synthase A
MTIPDSGVAQQRDAERQPSESHPHFRPHLMQGWSPDFIPRLVEDAVDGELLDEVVPVAGNDALRLSRALAQEEEIGIEHERDPGLDPYSLLPQWLHARAS